jgi:SAM-dependent methyltransferase
VTTAVDAWERYAGKAQPRRAINAAGATTWFNWTQYPDHGPDESVLGNLRDRAVLELGSGSGANLAHLATLGGRCVGVDIAPSREVTARRQWAGPSCLDFVTADVVDYLKTTEKTFDAVYSVFGAVWFTDPVILLPLVRRSMKRGGVFAFSQLPPVGSDADHEGVVIKWGCSAEQWTELLTAAGFGTVQAETIAGPTGTQVGTLLVRAMAV